MPTKILTVEDLADFKSDIFNKIDEIKSIQNQQVSKRWLRTDEAAEYLNIAKSTLQNYRINKVIPASKIAGSYYYDIQDIDRLLLDKKI
ncbi:helix-turn-helix domain-containing protein [Psychroflexus sp. ALD_RP9]|jgi:excisionase family DNA binding protein|uniref:helix-turn-helix domain-containing protein n=1 Tax=Psychroflexus sp. ALD_RP9 TaxID=2777186 RepID=UPI001A8C0D3B|nr:helix-turn-helix domain-containing protein [Psychroflexus sp. ALD_RP9]QSS96283.1 helix-turn-helix domain-containing protein [Psychroflexus sp. ALD_RP9]